MGATHGALHVASHRGHHRSSVGRGDARVTRSSILAALGLLHALSGCSNSETRAHVASDPLALRPLHAEPDPGNGGAIVDGDGRVVLLRGVNVNALAEYWKGTNFDTTFPLTDADVDTLAGIGWNAVRLLVSWSKVEPSPGAYDEAYLATVDDAIR